MWYKKVLSTMGRAVLFALTLGINAQAQNLAEFEKKVTEFTLDNGLKFIVVERHEAPVTYFLTYADVGSVNEVAGITGIAHIFEHMAFKGSTRIGTRNYGAEKAAMQGMDRLFAEIKKERQKGTKADPARLEELKKQFEATQKECDQYLVHDEYQTALEREGDSYLNAFTSDDFTGYIGALPSNKMELWMSLESERFCDPVLREFYKERDVIAEERRLGENHPISRLYEEFFACAFKAHSYGVPVVGHMSDIQSITRAQAEAWFAKYYSAANLTVAIVGDVQPAQTRSLAQIYFGRLPRKDKPDPVETVEPEQPGERRCTVVGKAEPMLLIGYHRPALDHPDNPVFDVISEIMGRGRTSRLYQTLVKEKKITVNVYAAAASAAKYPSLFCYMATPAQEHSTEENETAIYAEIEKLRQELVTPEELQKAKTRVKADLIRQLNDNFSLCYSLPYYEAVTGDWRNMFRAVDHVAHVTAEDVKRVANQCFTVKNRTVATLITEK
jgi:predicted Zn-dependent peptidase